MRSPSPPGWAPSPPPIFALCSAGDHIVIGRQIYAGTIALVQGPCARLGIEHTVVDGTDPGAFAAAVQPGRTMLVIAESPSNPRVDLVDLDALGAIQGPFTMLDSTFATPIGQQPIRHGIDLVVHSATKGISGHNDATLGVVAGERELLDAIWAYAVLHGASASPYDALNGLRGIRTLAVRQRYQADLALTVAEALACHPGVAAVHHPGLPDHPQHELAVRQLTCLPTVLAIDLAGGIDAARTMIDALRVARSATSLGGPETLVCHPATSTHVSLTPEEQAAIGITPGLVRISIGLEDGADVATRSGARHPDLERVCDPVTGRPPVLASRRDPASHDGSAGAEKPWRNVDRCVPWRHVVAARRPCCSPTYRA